MPSPIRVVHICENPIAGAPIALSKALNKWSEKRIQSRHIAASDRNEKRVYDHDLLINDSNYNEIAKVISESDIIHLHNFHRNQELFRRWPRLWDVVMRKRRVWQAHTQRNIAWMSMEDGLRDRDAVHLVIAQYHPRMYPECQVVPNIVDITTPELSPTRRGYRPSARVVYSPSRIGLRGWDDKGYDQTAPVLHKLVSAGILSADIIMDVPHRECLARKQTGDIGIDEIVTGSYHLCSLETLAQGLITIAGLDDLQVRTLTDLTGCKPSELPWVIATPKTLEKELCTLAALSRDRIEEKQAYSRAWMEKYWHPKKAIERFVDVYESLIKQ
jgi:hypothetical protein